MTTLGAGLLTIRYAENPSGDPLGLDPDSARLLRFKRGLMASRTRSSHVGISVKTMSVGAPWSV